jgi:hypothetical protein
MSTSFQSARLLFRLKHGPPAPLGSARDDGRPDPIISILSEVDRKRHPGSSGRPDFANQRTVGWGHAPTLNWITGRNPGIQATKQGAHTGVAQVH